jgi:hypothetical protein
MRSIVVLFVALVLANPALARHRETVPVAALSAPDALATVPAVSTVEAGVEVSRTWTLTAAQYAGMSLRTELDVRFGPTENDRSDDATVSVWSETNPVHAYEMHRTHLARIVIVREAADVKVTVFAARAAAPVLTASAN